MAATIFSKRICKKSRLCQIAILPIIISLIMFSGCNSSSDTKTAVQNATSFGLQASITSPGSDVEIAPGDSLIFSTAPTGGSSSYSFAWNFPGGNPLNSIDQSPTVTFAEKGVYTASLTITDSNNNTVSDTVKVTVTDSPTLVASITSPAASTTIQSGDAISFQGLATGGVQSNPPQAGAWL